MTQAVANIARPGFPLSQEELLQILDLARWAPSGDNCQPWRVRLSREEPILEILAVGTDQPAFLDYRLEATRMAIGAFAENVRLAATSVGSICDVSFSDDPSDPVWARCDFTPQSASRCDPLANFICSRVSNRRLYVPNSCSQADLDAIYKSVGEYPDVDLRLFHTADDRSTIASAVAIADRVRMQHRQCHEEFHEKVRWSREDAIKDPTGFDVKTFEIKPHEAWLLRATKSYWAMKVIDHLTGLSYLASRVAYNQVIQSGAIGMLCVTPHTTVSQFSMGRALQRIWLTATARGLCFQVLGVLPLFLRRVDSESRGFSKQQVWRLHQAREEMRQLLPEPEHISIMFRIGRSAPSSARSERMAAKELILNQFSD